MAKNTTEANVVVTLNGETARNELKKLEDELKKYRDAAEDAYEHGNKALGDEMTKKAERLASEFKSTKKEMKDFSDFMKNLNSKSLNELKSAATQLKNQIKGLAPGTQEFIDKTKQLQQVNTRVKQLESSFKGLVAEEKQATFSIKGLADGFNKYFGMLTAGIAAITGVSMAFRKCAEDAAVLDDVYSDVMKTTGLTHDEVQALDEELMKLDTRTSREQLLNLARDAGKLGIQGSNDVLAFVRAADQIQVALGEDLGDGAIKNLGKISDVFGYTKKMGIESSMLSIGSAINAVGQSSTASEAYLVDFTQRLAGIGAQTKISAANIIGFASGLDQSAMKVEMAATAFQTFLTKMYEDPAKFAEYANMEVEKFTNLLNNDANTAVMTILRNLKDQDGFAALVPIFKDMGVDGARATSVLAAMASNLDAITDAQSIANVEFEKATSLSNEFTTKNNNMQASLDKARKEFKNASITLGQSLNPIMLKTTNATTYLIKALAKYGKEIGTAAIAVGTLVAIIKAQTIAEAARSVALKVSNTLQATGTVLSNKLYAAYYRMTGQTMKLASAQQAANAAMSKSVYGAIAIAVATLTFAVSKYVNKQREANEELRKKSRIENDMDELQKRITDEYAQQASKIEYLNDKIHNNNISLAKRKEALEKLKQLVPDYHAELTEEGVLYKDNFSAIDDYNKKLADKIALQMYDEEITEQYRKKITEEKRLREEMNKIQAYGIKHGGSHSSEDGNEYLDNQGNWRYTEKGAEKAREDFKKNFIDPVMASYDKGIKKIKSDMETIADRLSDDLIEDDTQSGDGGGDGNDDLQKKNFDARIKVIQQQLKTEERELKLSLLRKQIDENEYEVSLRDAKVKYFKDKIDAAKLYLQSETEIMNEFYDWQIQEVEKSNKQQQEMLDALAQVELARKKKEEDEETKAIENQGKKLQNEQEILEKDLARVKERIGKDTWKEELEFELWKLNELHDQGILSERDYQEAKLKIKLEYAKKAANQVNQVSEMASNFVTQLKAMETAQMESEYQAQLTAAGDNAEKREAIEAEYEQKKLDLQKKYADTEMVINIAKAIAAGALAAVEAFAAAGNPILGAVFAAIVAATTALEVATIVKQRNAIKNTSPGGGGGSSLNTGSREITGYAEGGYTEDHTTVTTVGERGREWVAPAWMVRKNPVTFSNLERYRKTGSHGRSGSVSRGFADGGFTESASERMAGGMYTTADLEAAVETAIARSMANGAIRAYLVRNDLTELDAQTERFKKQTSR